jgi:hypothetical protein
MLHRHEDSLTASQRVAISTQVGLRVAHMLQAEENALSLETDDAITAR